MQLNLRQLVLLFHGVTATKIEGGNIEIEQVDIDRGNTLRFNKRRRICKGHEA